MEVQSQYGSMLEFPQKLFLVAVAVGWSGALAEIFLDSGPPLVAIQVAAAAIGMRLPRRQFLILLGLLSVATVLPASLRPDDGAWMQRWVALACLAAVGIAGWYAPKAHDPEGHVANAVESAAAENDPPQDPSTLIQIDANQAKVNVATNDYSFIEVNSQIGNFVIGQPIGRGGEGNVYRGRDVRNGEPAAIKILHDKRINMRFRREMQLVQKLAHPNIVTAYEVGECQGFPFIAMELLRGPDLNVHVHDSGRLGWLMSSRYVLQMARALSHAHHRGLIHRDVKPGNIILSGQGRVKLADLGLASMSGEASDHDGESGEGERGHDTQDGHLAGTLPYMAPEQARSLKSANVQSDIYSLGATWFYLLTGKTRLPGRTFTRQFENLLVKRRFHALPDDCLPDAVYKVYRRMVKYDARQRYNNCTELAADLELVLGGEGESETPEQINVLVVEDSQTDMLMTIEILRKTNQSLLIHQAKTLSQGIDKFRQLHIDLVLLDLSLPDSAGVETVIGFRRSAPQVPIVVLTGMPQQEISAACIEAGATSFVSKSGLNAHIMERTIFVTLSRSRMSHSGCS